MALASTLAGIGGDPIAWFSTFWTVIGGLAGIIGTGAGIASVVVTVLIYMWTRAVKPHWQLTRTVFEIPKHWAPHGQSQQMLVELWLENVGGSTAPAAYANVFYPGLGWIEEPPTGRTTIRVGEFLKFRRDVRRLETDVPPGWSGQRRYMRGDDVFWDLRGIRAEVRWGPNGRYSQVINDLHHQQLRAPVLDSHDAYPDRTR